MMARILSLEHKQRKNCWALLSVQKPSHRIMTQDLLSGQAAQCITLA